MEEHIKGVGLAATCEASIDPSGMPTFRLAGELDIASVGGIREVIDPFVADRPSRVIFELSELRFMDSTGLSLFLKVAGQVGLVELRNPSATIRKVIDLTGLSGIFIITP